MTRLAQLGVFFVVLGGVVLFLGLFPQAIDAEHTPEIGPVQLVTMLAGLTMLVLGTYLFAYATIHRGQPRTLQRDVGVRMGMTGLVFAAAATMADIMGFGSHLPSEGIYFGWLQATGMLVGFGIAALGVLIYVLAR
jgi:cellobiose-specific phosphotransferase system component IIC